MYFTVFLFIFFVFSSSFSSSCFVTRQLHHISVHFITLNGKNERTRTRESKEPHAHTHTTYTFKFGLTFSILICLELLCCSFCSLSFSSFLELNSNFYLFISFSFVFLLHRHLLLLPNHMIRKLIPVCAKWIMSILLLEPATFRIYFGIVQRSF